jgi:hypothetical protein
LSRLVLREEGATILAQYVSTPALTIQSVRASLYIAGMSLNWMQLRPWDGSQNRAFEELCCQLAHAEAFPPASRFTRKGTPDAGVECYWTLPTGDETAWQAKFFSSLGESQWKQIDKSVRDALDKHPRLARYVVCLPFDRADPRIEKEGKKQKSAMSEWDTHVKTWTQWAKDRSMEVSFDYWGDHEISSRLSLEEQHGRHYFWFHEDRFGPQWFQQRFDEARANVGERYTPELNVDLPVARLFDGLGRTEAFRLRFLTLRGKIQKESEWLAPTTVIKDEQLYRPIADGVHEIVQRLAVFEDDDHLATYDFVVLTNLASETADLAYRCGYALEEKARVGRNRDAYSYERHHAYQLGALLRDIAEESVSTTANAANMHAVLLDGEAGHGKTHLLFDVAERRIAAKQPTVILLGGQFTKGDPWTQVLQLLHVDCKRDEFLGALDAAAEARRSRALILIDALNEGDDRTIWKKGLAGFLTACARYPRISVAVTVRTSYVTDVLPDGLGEKLTRETHHGFAEHEYQATRTFFGWFGIKRPSIPLLNPEFQNPLFLKLFCKGIKDAGLTEMPTGLHGVTQMFDFLLDAVNQKLSASDHLDFDPKKRLVHEALRSVAEGLAASDSHFLTRDQAQVIVDAHLPSRTYNHSLFARLLSEGLLAEERVWRKDGIHEGIRFAYERLQDHQIASYLLGMHVGAAGVAAAFAPDQLLGARVRQYTSEWTFGLIDALAIQVPERYGVELPAVMPDAATSSPMRRAFIRSLLWRRPESIGEPAKQYLRSGLRYEEFEVFLDVALTVAANPDHPFNADYLHARLMRDAMPDRDAWWSIYLSEQFGQHTAVDRLVEWAWSPEDKAHIDDESVRLAATALMWFLTTPHRPLRDRATKALVRLLTPRLHILDGLLTTFRDVDDRYVRERLYGVAYGCVLRSSDDAAVGKIAKRVFDDLFSDGAPTPHVLLRDYGRGVMERAAFLGVDGGVDLALARPPYKSEWLEDLPSAEELEAKYERPAEGAADEEYALRTIYFSVAGGGDFDRYVIGTNSHAFNWTANRLGEEPPLTRRERYEAFVTTLTGRQQEALERLEDAYRNRIFLIIRPPRGEDEPLYDEPDDSEGTMSKLRIGPRIVTARSEDDEHVVRLEAEAARDIEIAERAFRRTLGMAKAARFDTEAVPYLHRPGKDEEHRFDLGIAHRFVLNRVLELGWTVERFGAFDRNLGRYSNDGRAANKPERIGKKYQWLAWHEFLARVADHFQYKDDMTPEVGQYDGPWQDFDRDLDPSLLIASTASQRSLPAEVWWSPRLPYGEWRSIGSDAAWAAQGSDLPEVEPLIAVRRPDGREFLVLETYREWTEPAPPGVERYDIERREIYYMINSYLVKREDADTVYEWGRTQNFFGRWMPESHEMTRVYFGELFWAPAFHYHSTRHTGRPAWVGADDEDSSLPAPILVATDAYMCEHSTFDCSLDDTVNIHLPAAELVEWMGLTWRGKEGYFVDEEGAEVAFDPSVFEAGPGAVVIDRERLTEMLEKQGLEIVWTVLGEKRVLAPMGEHRTAPFIISGCYRLRGGQLEGLVRVVAEDAERGGTD